MANFKDIERKIIELVNKIDPDDLIGCGAPPDEYLSQVHSIINILTRNKNQEEWEVEIFKVFFPHSNYQPSDAKEKIKNLTLVIKTEFPEGLFLQK